MFGGALRAARALRLRFGYAGRGACLCDGAIFVTAACGNVYGDIFLALGSACTVYECRAGIVPFDIGDGAENLVIGEFAGCRECAAVILDFTLCGGTEYGACSQQREDRLFCVDHRQVEVLGVIFFVWNDRMCNDPIQK